MRERNTTKVISLTFGLKCAPYIFNRISDFIVAVAEAYGVGEGGKLL